MSMFQTAKLQEECFYFIKTVTEQNILIDFIEKIKNNNEEDSVLSKWDKNYEAVETKHLLLNSIDKNNISKKDLYIINSIDMAINFPFSIYQENFKIRDEKFNSLSIYKIAAGHSADIIKMFGNKSLPQSILFLNDGGGTYYYYSGEDSPGFFVESGSCLIFNNIYPHRILTSGKEDLYIVHSFIGKA